MTDFYTSTILTPIQHRPVTLPTSSIPTSEQSYDGSAATDCYQRRTELIAAEANAVSEQEAEEIIDRRLEADEAVWSASIRDELDIAQKISVLASLTQSMTAAEMLPLIAELQRQIAEFAQAV